MLCDDVGFNTIPVTQSSLAKPPSRSRPFDPPLSRINFENNNLASLALLFHLFFDSSLRLIFSLSTSTSASDALRFLLSSVFPLGNGPDVWRNTRNPIASRRIVDTSSFFPSYLWNARKREKRMKERSIKKEKERCEILADSLQVLGEQGVSTRMHRIVPCVLERPHFARTSYVWEWSIHNDENLFPKLLWGKIFRDIFLNLHILLPCCLKSLRLFVAVYESCTLRHRLYSASISCALRCWRNCWLSTYFESDVNWISSRYEFQWDANTNWCRLLL